MCSFAINTVLKSCPINDTSFVIDEKRKVKVSVKQFSIRVSKKKKKKKKMDAFYLLQVFWFKVNPILLLLTNILIIRNR